MKPEYKNRLQENLDAIRKRSQVVSEMVRGERPSNPQDANKLLLEIERLVEMSQNIVDLS
jgi:hypothetical protein